MVENSKDSKKVPSPDFKVREGLRSGQVADLVACLRFKATGEGYLVYAKELPESLIEPVDLTVHSNEDSKK